MKNLIKFGGIFNWRVLGPDGKVVRPWSKFNNGPTIAGLNHLLATEYVAGAQATTWGVGLIDGTAPPSLSPNDTMAIHPGWIENTSYSGGSRIIWNPVAPAGGLVANVVSMQFTMNAVTKVAGAFLCSSATLGGTAGTLATTGLGSAFQSLTPNQVLQVKYGITLTPVG